MNPLFSVGLFTTLFIIFAIFFCNKLYPENAEEYFLVTLSSAACAGVLTSIVALSLISPAVPLLLLTVALMFGIVYIINHIINGRK